MFKNTILFCNKLGQNKIGVDKAPLILQSLISSNSNIINTKVGNCLNTNLFNLYKENKSIDGPRINIGGDHSMSISTIADSLNRYNNLKVIWMDAHCDINTYNSSTTKNYHGMPLSILTDIEEKKNLNFSKNKLDFDNLLYLGIRSIDAFEQDIVNRHNIKYINSTEINSNIDEVINKIDKFIKDSPVHFSFDVDSIDPKFMPSTGTKVKNGMHLEESKKIIDFIFKKNLISFDLTELNLEIGTNEDKKKSLDNLKYLLENYL